MRAVRRALSLVAIAAIGITACERAAVVDPMSPDMGIQSVVVTPPLPASTPYPATQQPDQGILCKDASSPAGSYTFAISASSTIAGDEVASAATLAPGQCAIVFRRTGHSDTFARVTFNEQIPQGATYRVNHVAVNDLSGPRNVPGPSVTLIVNSFHGAVATFFNETAPSSGLPTPTPYPASQQPDKAIVCKDASSPQGSYTFNISAGGALAGDQVATSATLQPGQCAIVYVRGTSSSSFTSVTSAEVIPQGATFALNHVAVNDIDGPRNTPGPGVTLKVNNFHGSVATYFNEAAGGVSPQRQITVCKAGQVHGSFNFNAVATGTIGSDVLTSAFSLTSGACQVIFVRPIPGLVSASVTIAETVNVGTTLNSVTVNGSPAVIVGNGVVVPLGSDADKVVVFTNIIPTAGVSPVNLGAAGTFGILAGTTVTCVTGGIVNADIGISPGNALTGFGPCTLSGIKHLADPISAQAQLDLTVAYNLLAGLPCPPANVLSADIGGTTRTAGVYCSATGIGLTGTVTLDGGGDPNAIFVFQSGSTLVTAGDVNLINGAQAKNVFFQVGSSATLGNNSTIRGNILAQTSITLNNSVTLIGRALARTGAVTLGTNDTITLP